MLAWHQAIMVVCLQEAAACIVTKRVHLMILVGVKWLASGLISTWWPSQAGCTIKPCGTFHPSSGLIHFRKNWLPFTLGCPVACLTHPLPFKLSPMRQDDLESLAYTLLEVCHGSLPWCLTAGKEFEEGHDWYSARQLHGMALERIQVGT